MLRPCQLLLTLLLFSSSASATAAPPPQQQHAPRPPNVIVILSDDMGYSDLGCYGGEINTPNLDRLAAGGVRFTQFYNTARCCPTRASLLTGLYPHQAGIGHMMDDRGKPGYRGDLNRNCLTIAEALKTAGYSSYAVGKWHVTRHTKPEGPNHNWPLQRGFDRFYGTIHGAGSYYDPSALVRDNTMLSVASDPDYKPARYYYTDAISDHAVRFVREHARDHPARPFFLYVAYTAAHWPMHALEEDIAKYRGKYSAGYEPVRQARFEKAKRLGLIDPKWTLTPIAGSWETETNRTWEARGMEVYAAMVDRMDQGIGRLVAALEDGRQLENTLIFFLQDNGGCAETVGRTENQVRSATSTLPPMKPQDLQEGSRPKQTRDGRPVVSGPNVMPGPDDTYVAYGKAWANVSNTPFREYKHWVHEGGIATPLIVHWPRGIPAGGQLRHQPGHLIDIMATCVDVAGVRYPSEFAGQPLTPLEGRSLRPAFENKPLQREAIYWEHEGNRAVRQGPWKLVAKKPAGAWELYNLEADRTEMLDRAAELPDRARAMAAAWEDWARRAHVLPWIWTPAYGSREPADGAHPTRFDLKSGDDLPQEAAPRIAGRGFNVTAEIEGPARDGVILAQGGSTEGFSLYLKDAKAVLAIRRRGVLSRVVSQERLPEGSFVLAARLSGNGALTLSIGDRVIGSGHAPGTLSRMPADGLQVGRDANGAVGEYATPFPFSGRIGKVVLELEPVASSEAPRPN